MSRATSLYSFTCAAFAALVVALATAGCFSEHVTAAEGPTGQELCGGTQPNVVRIRNFAFAPATLTVARGAAVTWVNCDADPHTATSSGGIWDSGTMTRYVKYERTFAAAGSFPYICDIHPGMQATVVVAP